MVKNIYRNGEKWSYVDQIKTRNKAGKIVTGGYYVASGKGTTNWYNKNKSFKLKSQAISYAKRIIK